MRAYLRPHGHLVAQMSGTFAPFSVAGKVMLDEQDLYADGVIPSTIRALN